jgi:hypothetical protein
MPEIEAVASDGLDYLNSREGAGLLLLNAERDVRAIHADKSPPTLQDFFQIHPEKLAYRLRAVLRRADSRFAEFYMTLLAARLSERTGASLVTPLAAAEHLALRARCDAEVQQPLSNALIGQQRRTWSEYAVAGDRHETPHEVAVGAIAHLAMDRISIEPETPIDKLIDFRTRHHDELVQFRNKIEQLASAIKSDLPESALRQKVQDIYDHDVAPAVLNVKRALSGRTIRSVTDGVMKVGFLSVSSTSMLTTLGLSVPMALLAGAGISLIAASTVYRVDKTEAMRVNPFSYLLSLERQFGR